MINPTHTDRAATRTLVKHTTLNRAAAAAQSRSRDKTRSCANRPPNQAARRWALLRESITLDVVSRLTYKRGMAKPIPSSPLRWFPEFLAAGSRRLRPQSRSARLVAGRRRHRRPRHGVVLRGWAVCFSLHLERGGRLPTGRGRRRDAPFLGRLAACRRLGASGRHRGQTHLASLAVDRDCDSRRAGLRLDRLYIRSRSRRARH